MDFKIILDNLATSRNFGVIIELAKTYTEINLEDYFHLCPDINVNASPLDYSGSGFVSYNLTHIESFQLNDETIHTDLSFFLKNLDRIKYFVVSKHKIFVIDGEFNIGDDGFRSIEFKLHNLSGFARPFHEKYAVHGIFLSEKDYTRVSRHNKLSILTDNSKSTKDLINEMRKIVSEKIQLEHKKKKEEKRNKEFKQVSWTTFKVDGVPNIHAKFA